MDVRMPDGTMVRNVPDDMTQTDLMAKLQSAGVQPGAAPQPNMVRTALSGLPMGEYAPEALKGITSLIHGAAELGAHGIDAIRPGTGAVDAVNQWGKNRDQAFQQMFGDPPSKLAGAVAEGAGAGLTTAPFMPAAAATAIGRVLQGGGIAAAQGAVTPIGASQNWAADKGKQIAGSALLGGGLGAALEGASRVLNPNVSPAVRTLMDEGVTPSPGQVLGGTAKWTEEKATSIPLLGDAIKMGQNRAIGEYNKAIYNRVLGPIGQEFPADVPVGNKGVAYVGDKLSEAYDALIPQMGAKMDQPFMRDMGQLMQMSNEMEPSRAQQFRTIINNQVISKFTPDGLMSGQTLKDVESRLGQLAKQYRGRGDGDQELLSNALRQAQANVRSMVARSDPASADALQAINSGWANLAQLETAAGRVGSKEGVVSPAQYLGAIKQSDGSVRDRAFARGEVRNQDLAQAGKSVLAPEIADSGSVGRGMMGVLLAGGAHHLTGPVAPAMGGLAALMYTPAGQRIMAAILAQRGPAAMAAGQALPSATPLAAPAAAGLLSQFSQP